MRPQPATAPDAAPEPAPAGEAAPARGGRLQAVLDEVRESALRVTLALEQALVAAAVRAVTEGDAPAGGGEGPDPGPGGRARPAPGPAPAKTLAELALAYARASRAVRMSVFLQDRLLKEAQAPAGADGPQQTHLRVTFVDPADPESVAALNAQFASRARPAPPPVPEAAPAPLASRAEVEGVVRSVAQAGLLPGEHGAREAAEIVERLVREAAEQLETEDEYQALMRRPVSEIVEKLCRDVGMTPHWDRLAEEPWARREIESGRAGAPLAAFRPRPPPPDHPAGAASPLRPAEWPPDTASPWPIPCSPPRSSS